MELLTKNELSEMPYRTLQKIAKDNGVKANLPKLALIDKIVKLSENQKIVTNDETECSDMDKENKNSNNNENDKSFTKDNELKCSSSNDIKILNNTFNLKNENDCHQINKNTYDKDTKNHTSCIQSQEETSFYSPSSKESNVLNVTFKVEKHKDSISNDLNSRLNNTTFIQQLSPKSKKKTRFLEYVTARKQSAVTTSDNSMIQNCEKNNLFPRQYSESKKSRVTKIPNFAKIHAQQFDNMDSLSTYLTKKKERLAKLNYTPTSVSHSIRRSPRLSSKQQTTSLTSKIPVFHFTAIQKPGTPKLRTSVVKTTENSTNTSMNSAKKKQFDLKASLKRPLNYKPYSGKLTKWEERNVQRKMGLKNLTKTSKTCSLIKKSDKRDEYINKRRRIP